MLWVAFLYALKIIKECMKDSILNVLSILFLSMFVDSVKVWKSECYTVTNPPILCHIQRHIKKKKRSNRIAIFTVLIFSLNPYCYGISSLTHISSGVRASHNDFSSYVKVTGSSPVCASNNNQIIKQSNGNRIL